MTVPATAAVQTTGLSKQIDGRWILRGVELRIERGECVALLGDNGAGKTTLLRCLAALARPTSGKVHWWGEPAGQSPRQRGVIGMATHQGGLYGELSPRENLRFAARMHGIAEPLARIDQLLATCGLRSHEDRPVKKLSLGMRQRLVLLRAVVHQPTILLLDEPSTGLDATSRDWLRELLNQWSSGGAAVCFATHDPAFASGVANRTILLQDGVLHESVPSQALHSPLSTWRWAS